MRTRKCFLIAGVAVLLCLAIPAAAGAQSWDASFSRETLATYLPERPSALLLAVAGSRNAETEHCAKVLQTVLRSCSAVKLVMSDEAIGSLQGLDDRSIVSRAAKLPVEAIVVLRVFSGAAERQPSAVVTLYDPSGRTLSGFTATRGEPMPRRQSPPRAASAGSGVDVGVVATVDKVLKTTGTETKSRRADYRHRRIWFENVTAVDLQTGGVVARWSTPLLGDTGQVLDGPRFYEQIGRKDLADRYRRKRITKWVLGGTGLGVSLAGLGVGLAVALQPGDGPSYERPNLGVGLGITAAGVVVGQVLMWTGIFLNPHPVKTEEAFALANRYNKQLQTELGIEDDEGNETHVRKTSAPPPSPRVRPSVTPLLAGGRYGLGLGLTF